MTISKLEALCDAISAINGAKDPIHPAYQARNPLRLQIFTSEGKATGKLRHFPTFHGGYLAALFDLRIKCSGRSRARLGDEDFTLTGLMRVYNLKPETAIYVARFLRKALNDESISERTRLDYFLDSAQAEKVGTDGRQQQSISG